LTTKQRIGLHFGLHFGLYLSTIKIMYQFWQNRGLGCILGYVFHKLIWPPWLEQSAGRSTRTWRWTSSWSRRRKIREPTRRSAPPATKGFRTGQLLNYMHAFSSNFGYFTSFWKDTGDLILIYLLVAFTFVYRVSLSSVLQGEHLFCYKNELHYSNLSCYSVKLILQRLQGEYRYCNLYRVSPIKMFTGWACARRARPSFRSALWRVGRWWTCRRCGPARSATTARTSKTSPCDKTVLSAIFLSMNETLFVKIIYFQATVNVPF
jgi:hypothetical protein